MLRNILITACTLILLGSCASSSRNSHSRNNSVKTNTGWIDLAADRTPLSLTDLPRTQDGAFVLSPGYYEAEFKSYCLQPGTPDPSPRDAYLQAPLNGYRKDIVQTVLYNSRTRSDIDQRNVQLLLWSVVSGTDFRKLSPDVQEDARQLLTSKQVFELKGGVAGAIRNISNHMPGGVINGNYDIRRVFELGSASYEMVERIAVLREASTIKRADYKNDQWYKQEQNYYVRYFPVSYKKVRIQVYVPDGAVDSTGKVSGEYLVFDPTGYQAIPANSNAQRLGIGGSVLDIVRVIIDINKNQIPPKRLPDNKKNKKTEIPNKKY